MKRVATTLLLTALLMPVLVTAQGRRGLSPAQLTEAGWTCFDVPGLGVHCAAPGESLPFTAPTVQLLYFFNTTDPASTEPDFTGTETLLREDLYRGQPCPTEASGQYFFLGDLGGGVGYYACHRR